MEIYTIYTITVSYSAIRSPAASDILFISEKKT